MDLEVVQQLELFDTLRTNLHCNECKFFIFQLRYLIEKKGEFC